MGHPSQTHQEPLGLHSHSKVKISLASKADGEDNWDGTLLTAPSALPGGALQCQGHTVFEGTPSSTGSPEPTGPCTWLEEPQFCTRGATRAGPGRPGGQVTTGSLGACHPKPRTGLREQRLGSCPGHLSAASSAHRSLELLWHLLPGGPQVCFERLCQELPYCTPRCGRRGWAERAGSAIALRAPLAPAPPRPRRPRPRLPGIPWRREAAPQPGRGRHL